MSKKAERSMKEDIENNPELYKALASEPDSIPSEQDDE